MNRDKDSGFTLAEFIVASAISSAVIIGGYAVVQVLMQTTEIEERNLTAKGNVEDALDFIMDEVNRGKKIIDNESDIKKENPICTIPPGKFLFGVKLPGQALSNKDYKDKDIDTKTGKLKLSKVECPIVYYLKNSTSQEKKGLTLFRYGPQLTKKGFYESPSSKNYKNSPLLEGILQSSKNNENLLCPPNWKTVKKIEGFQYCLDNNNKAIEIMIVAEDALDDRQKANVVSSFGGFTRIQDEGLINMNPGDVKKGVIPPCFGGPCNWMGVGIKSNKVTFMIDKSGSMSSYFRHWDCSKNSYGRFSCRVVTPRIQGQGLFDAARSNLRQQVVKLPTRSEVDKLNKQYGSNYEYIRLQIIAFNSYNYPVFSGGPQILTQSTKAQALRWIDQLRPGGGTNPWSGLCSSLQDDKNVGQVILLSDGIPNRYSGSCAGKYGNYANVINDYNRNERSKKDSGELIIDSISFFHNFCDKNENPWNRDWLGQISSGKQSKCTNVK